MKNTKRMLILCAMMIALSSCSKQNKENVSSEASPSKDVVATNIATSIPTVEPSEPPTKKPKKQSSTSLKEYLNDYTDSKTYHLLYDVALNKKASTNMDKDVTYMFPNDDNGKREIGGVIAYYDNIKKVKAKNVDDFIYNYVSKYFPELSDSLKSGKTLKEDGYTVKTIEFNDYNIIFMSNKEMTSITFILTESEN